jgi:hypothetical protein
MIAAAMYRLARQHFGEKELVDLTIAVITINGWNRLAVGFRTGPGVVSAGSFPRSSGRGERSRGIGIPRRLLTRGEALTTAEMRGGDRERAPAPSTRRFRRDMLENGT